MRICSLELGMMCVSHTHQLVVSLRLYSKPVPSNPRDLASIISQASRKRKYLPIVGRELHSRHIKPTGRISRRLERSPRLAQNRPLLVQSESNRRPQNVALAGCCGMTHWPLLSDHQRGIAHGP